MIKKKNRTNAESFAQLLIEIKKLNPKVKDVYYSTHVGNWTIEYTNGESEEMPESAAFLRNELLR